MKTTSIFSIAIILATCAIGTASAQVTASLGDNYSPVTYEDTGGYIEDDYAATSCDSCGPVVDTGVYSAPVAQACCSSAGYFSIFGGGTSYDHIETSTLNVQNSPFGNFEDGLANVELEEGWAIGAAIGRRLSRRFRTEFEVSYRSATADYGSLFGNGSGSGPLFPLDPINIPGVGQITPPPVQLPGFGDLQTGTLPVDGRLNSYALMTNLVMDLNPGMSTVFYVGGGVGANINSLNVNEPTNQIDISVNNSTFAYQALAGVSRRLGQAELFGEYRFFGTDKQSLEVDSPLGSLTVDGDGSGHNYFFGLRFGLP